MLRVCQDFLLIQSTIHLALYAILFIIVDVYRVMCSTINAVPETQSLLGKLKLPLGIHIHPYQSLTFQVNNSSTKYLVVA